MPSCWKSLEKNQYTCICYRCRAWIWAIHGLPTQSANCAELRHEGWTQIQLNYELACGNHRLGNGKRQRSGHKDIDWLYTANYTYHSALSVLGILWCFLWSNFQQAWGGHYVFHFTSLWSLTNTLERLLAAGYKGNTNIQCTCTCHAWCMHLHMLYNWITIVHVCN